MAKSKLTSKEQYLRGVGLFKQLNDRQIAELSQVADLVTVPEGRVLITEGRLGRQLIVILDGSVEVRRGDRLIATLGVGDVVGELSLLDHREATATVVTTEPCELCVVEGRRFQPLLELPGFAAGLLAEVAGRLRRTDEAFDV